MVAELQRTTGSAPVQLVQEFPDRLRLVVQSGSSARVVTFDGNEAKGLDQPPDAGERNLIESLVYDSTEHFFISQTRGQTARVLGFRFRSDDGRYYDIYELADAVRVDTVSRAQTKHYYLNSDTQLLEKVRYVIERNGTTIHVETRFEDWQTSEQQRFPSRISRFENGNRVWKISASSVTLSPMADDGIFSRP